jgi:3-dehydroquinate dehydratase-1
LGGGALPAVCAPLVARTPEALLAEAAAVAAKKPDLLEWRVDFFEGIADAAAVAELAGRIGRAAGGLPLLFTCRSQGEGGENIPLTGQQVVGLYRAVCEGGQIDLVDFEMGREAAHVAQVREAARAAGAQLILSFHDFERTPSAQVLSQRFAQAQEMGADIAKVAVMPQDMQDVLALLAATLAASRELDIPVAGMSMGGLGSITRLCGGAFGSALTFAIGQGASAPGQMPIEELHRGLELLRRAMGKPA